MLTPLQQGNRVPPPSKRKRGASRRVRVAALAQRRTSGRRRRFPENTKGACRGDCPGIEWHMPSLWLKHGRDEISKIGSSQGASWSQPSLVICPSSIWLLLFSICMYKNKTLYVSVVSSCRPRFVSNASKPTPGLRLGLSSNLKTRDLNAMAGPAAQLAHCNPRSSFVPGARCPSFGAARSRTRRAFLRATPWITVRSIIQFDPSSHSNVSDVMMLVSRRCWTVTAGL
ncbi:hypothetical protein DFH11DRAFT_625090 [Phellopilus nigrolimitatus]|nr:hypothetical protein DFH11DRAFT_625090 [Phellopilus nigrolimitatus]